MYVCDWFVGGRACLVLVCDLSLCNCVKDLCCVFCFVLFVCKCVNTCLCIFNMLCCVRMYFCYMCNVCVVSEWVFGVCI